MKLTAKRTLIAALMLVLVATLFGCGGTTPTATTAPTAAPATAAPAQTSSAAVTAAPADDGKYYNEPGVLPIVKEPITLTVGIPQSSGVEDWKQTYQTKYMEEKTGITFEFEVYPSDEINTKLELMVAAGGNDLPNVIIRGLGQSIIMPWAEAGMIQPLTDYYNDLFYWGQQTIDLSSTLTKEYIMKYVTSYDGNIYGVYSFNDTQNNQYSASRINIYRPWLQELGLPIPSTTDNFLSTLIAFRDGDLNKNGQKDEIPLSGEKNTIANTRKFLMTPFVYTQNEYWTATNGNIGVSFNTDEWREGLRYAANLYKEKLLDPAHFTNDGAAMTAVCSQDPQLYGAYTRISTSNMAADDLDRYNYDRIEQLTNSVTGVTMTSVQPALPSLTGFVTKTCQYPEAAYMWLDYMTGEDLSVLTRYGVEGQEWDYIDTAATKAALKKFWAEYPGGNLLEQFYGVGAEPRVGSRYFSATSWGTMQSTWWGQNGPNVMTEETQNSFGQKIPETEIEIASYVNEFYARKQLEEAMSYRDDSKIVAGLIYNAEEQAVITDVYTEIKLYVEETWASYVVGNLNIEDDAAWNNYIQTLDRMGVQRCIDAAQSCYTRMNSN